MSQGHLRVPIRAVAFDLDGLMFDTEALFFRVASTMLTARGKQFTPQIMAGMIGRPWAVAGPFFKSQAGLDDTLDELFVESRRLLDEHLDTAVHPTPGLFALLAHLERHAIPRGLTTSSRRPYAERLLRNHGLLGHFTFLLTAEDVTRAKPDPQIYQLAAARFGVSPAELLVLEDSPAGVAAARASGAFTVAVPHEHSPVDGLGQADLRIASLDDPRLLQLLRAPAGPESA